jgi:hypothetical protein
MPSLIVETFALLSTSTLKQKEDEKTTSRIMKTRQRQDRTRQGHEIRQDNKTQDEASDRLMRQRQTKG